jgi:hypothetical protein
MKRMKHTTFKNDHRIAILRTHLCVVLTRPATIKQAKKPRSNNLRISNYYLRQEASKKIRNHIWCQIG